MGLPLIQLYSFGPGNGLMTLLEILMCFGFALGCFIDAEFSSEKETQRRASLRTAFAILGLAALTWIIGPLPVTIIVLAIIILAIKALVLYLVRSFKEAFF